MTRTVRTGTGYGKYVEGELRKIRTGESMQIAALTPGVILAEASANGVSDDREAIQAAINKLPANGGTVLLPPGTVRVNTQITIGNGSSSAVSTRNGVRILGAGQSKDATTGATTLLWGGSAGAAMFLCQGPIQGVEIGHMNINLNNAGSIGIGARSVRGSLFHDLTIHNYLQYGFFGTVTDGAIEGSFANVVRNVQIASLAETAAGMFLHGDPVGMIDWTECQFDSVLIFFHGGVNSKGLWLGFTDGNQFNNLHVVAANLAANSNCIVFDGSIAPATFPNSNTFIKPTLSSNGVGVIGTPGQNTIYGYDTGNGAPLPSSLLLSGVSRDNRMFGRFHWLARATISGAVEIADNTPTKVSLDAADFDTGAFGLPLTVGITGKYRVSAGTTWESNSTGSRRVRVLADDVPIPGLADFKAADAESSCSIAGVASFTAGDVVELEVFQNSTAALDLASAALSLEYIPG